MNERCRQIWRMGKASKSAFYHESEGQLIAGVIVTWVKYGHIVETIHDEPQIEPQIKWRT
jgi:hypothetical protein